MGKYRSLGTLFNRVFRNDLNANFDDVDTDINAQKVRVDNLIVGTPQPSEVVDSRLDEKGTTHTTLKARLDTQMAQKATKIVVYLSDYYNLKIDKGGGEYDYSPCLQKAVKDVMNVGGGKIKCEAGRFPFYSTVYTHPSDMDITNFKFSPLTIEGVTPVNAGLYNTTKNITRFVMKGASGAILGVNFNGTTECVVTSVYRNFSIKNIGFFGGGTLDTKYTSVYASVLNVKGIEKRNASINIEDCYFWAMDWGIYDPETVLSVDNYCDQSTYRRLSFEAMGTGWIQAYRSDASVFEAIYGYDMAKTCRYGIRAKKGESFVIENVLCAGKAMHLATNFKMINLEYCNGVKMPTVYAERLEGIPIFLDNSKNIEIGVIDGRQYLRTLVKGTNNRNVHIGKVYCHIEENKILSPSDTGNYSVYDTVGNAIDFDFDSTNIDIRYDHFFIRNGVHSGGTFTETTARLFPRLNTVSKASYQIGKQYVFDVIHNGTDFVISANGVQIPFSTLFACSNPTFNTSTGEFSFPTDGAFASLSASHVSGRRSGTGVINNAYKVSSIPLIVRVLNTAGATITTPADVAFSVTLHC